jgi:short-subunit dehydrogenase
LIQRAALEAIETDQADVFSSMKDDIPAMLANGYGAIVNMSSANGMPKKGARKLGAEGATPVTLSGLTGTGL